MRDRLGNIFNPRGRKSAQNPQSGGESLSVTRQVINAIFGRTPLFFNAGLSDYISPVVDTTLYYPLQPMVKREVRTVEAGATLHQFQIKPPAGKHWMIPFLTVGVIDSSAGALGGAQLALQALPSNNLQVLNTQDFLATAPVLFNTENIAPLIGSKRIAVDNVTVPGVPYTSVYEGIKSLYLSSDMLGIVLCFQNATTIQGEVELLYTVLELPNNQPFGPAITM